MFLARHASGGLASRAGLAAGWLDQDDLIRDGAGTGCRASSVEATPSRLQELAQDASMAVRAAVAENRSTPRVVLMCLADDPGLNVQRALLRNPGTPESVLICLIGSRHSAIRFGVETHPNAGPATCHAIATTGTYAMRVNLAGRDIARDRAEQLARGRRPPPAPLAADVVDIPCVDPDCRVRAALSAATADPRCANGWPTMPTQ